MEIDPLFWERNMGLSTILNLFLILGEISTWKKLKSTYSKDFHGTMAQIHQISKKKYIQIINFLW
jgi:hypothetical protein